VSYDSRRRIEEARDRDLREVAVALGIEVRRGGKMAFCPDHSRGGQKGDPSLSFYRKGGVQRFRCHNCGAAGDVLDMVQWRRECALPQALDWLLGPEYSRASEQAKRRKWESLEAPAQVPLDERAAAARAFLEVLDEGGEGQREAREYLRSRGLTEPAGDTLAMRVCSPARARAGCDAVVRAVGLERAIELGYMWQRKRGHVAALKRKALVCPYLDGSGRPVHLQLRALDGSQPRWRHLPGEVPFPWGLHAAAQDAGAPVPLRIWLVEGAIDAASVQSRGGTALGLPGTGWLRPTRVGELVTMFPEAAWVVGFDADPPTKDKEGNVRPGAGPRATPRAVELLRGAGAQEVLVVDWPRAFRPAMGQPGRDWIDWWSASKTMPPVASPPPPAPAAHPPSGGNVSSPPPDDVPPPGDEDAPGDGGGSELPVVDWYLGKRPAPQLRAVVEVAADARRFYRWGGNLVYLRDGVTEVGERNVRGLLASHLEICRWKRNRKVEPDHEHAWLMSGHSTLSRDEANVLLSHHAIDGFPAIEYYTRTPVYTRSWRCVRTPGFDERSGVYYDGPPVQPRGPELLGELTSGFAWRAEADAAAFLAALLTGVLMPHWWDGNHPFLAVDANRQQIGKSTLVKVIGMILDGRSPRSMSLTEEEELEKQVATAVADGSRVLLIDNVRGSRAIASPRLERWITDTELTFRRLGSNTTIRRPHNDVLFALTMNDTQLNRDLRYRALPIRLYLEEDPREHDWPHADVLRWAADHRVGLLGALVGLVDRWIAAGRPEAERRPRHTVGRVWAATCAAILEHAGIPYFGANWEAAERAMNPDWEAMVQVAHAFVDGPRLTASDWGDRLLDSPLGHRLRDSRGKAYPPHSRAIRVGRIFAEFIGVRLLQDDGSGVRLVAERSSRLERTPRYSFVGE